MPPKNGKSLRTRQSLKDQFGGTPNPLPAADLPTYRDICRYLNLLELNKTKQPSHLARLEVTDYIGEQIFQLWRKVNPKLPLKPLKSVRRKVREYIDKVKRINMKRESLKAKVSCTAQLDQLFDICMCNCSLEIVSCKDAKCKLFCPECPVEECEHREKCRKKQIICVCCPKVRKDKNLNFYIIYFTDTTHNVLPAKPLQLDTSEEFLPPPPSP